MAEIVYISMIGLFVMVVGSILLYKCIQTEWHEVDVSPYDYKRLLIFP